MKVYFDKNLLGDKPRVSFLNPILGKYNKNVELPFLNGVHIKCYDEAQLDGRTKEGKKYLEIASKSECDYFIFPIPFILDYLDISIKFIKEAVSYNKSVIIFNYEDTEFDERFKKYKNVIIISHGKDCKYKYNKGNITMPSFPLNLGEIYTGLKYSDNKSYKISYCGYDGYYNTVSKISYCLHYLYFLTIYKSKFLKKFLISIFQNGYIKNLGIKIGLIKEKNTCITSLSYILNNAFIGKIYRHNALNLIKDNTKQTDFIIRKGMLSPNQKGIEREEYIKNILRIY